MQCAMYVRYCSTCPWVYAQFWISAVECNTSSKYLVPGVIRSCHGIT